MGRENSDQEDVGEATAEPCQGARQGLALAKIAYPTEGVMFDGLIWGSFPGWSWLGDRILKCLPAEQTTFHPGW